jgi:hypothetical protein
MQAYFGFKGSLEKVNDAAKEVVPQFAGPLCNKKSFQLPRLGFPNLIANFSNRRKAI